MEPGLKGRAYRSRAAYGGGTIIAPIGGTIIAA
jgi:hypothetical protein